MRASGDSVQMLLEPHHGIHGEQGFGNVRPGVRIESAQKGDARLDRACVCATGQCRKSELPDAIGHGAHQCLGIRRGDRLALEDECAEEVAASFKRNEAVPKPPLESLFEDVYAEPLRTHREQLQELEAAIAADPRVADPRHSDA